MESEFPSNSHKYKQKANQPKEEKKVEKVVTGEVVRRKPPLSRRFMETFFGGNDSKGVWDYVMFDVMVPAAKDMVSDAVSGGIERTLFGESHSSSRRRRSASAPRDYVSYNRYGPGGGRREDPRPATRRSRSSHDLEEIILATRVEAEEVVDGLYDLVSRYEMATVADLYGLVGTTGSYLDEKWGWTDIRTAGVRRVREGYLLDLPKPEYLD
jgi:hypothetical protein